jgi:hypothetical protein
MRGKNDQQLDRVWIYEIRTILVLLDNCRYGHVFRSKEAPPMQTNYSKHIRYATRRVEVSALYLLFS